MYEVELADLREWNGLKKGDPIKPGQTLVLKTTSTPAGQVTPPTSKYVVKQGDTLYGIAKSHDMELEELKLLNGKDDSTPLAIGEELIVYQ